MPSARSTAALAFGCLLLLAGCANEKVTATPRSIVFPGTNSDTIVDITAKAEEHCRRFGLHAQAVADGWPDGRSTFNCVQ